MLALLAAPAAARAQGVFGMGTLAADAAQQQVEMSARKRAGLPDKYGVKTPATTPVLASRFAYTPTAALPRHTAPCPAAFLACAASAAAWLLFPSQWQSC